MFRNPAIFSIMLLTGLFACSGSSEEAQQPAEQSLSDPAEVEGRAEMTITLTELRLGEEAYRVKTGNITIQAEGTQGRDAKIIGGAAGVGALLGEIIGGKKSAAAGAAVGGGAGTATVLTTKGKEVEFQAEHKFSFSLSREVEATLP